MNTRNNGPAGQPATGPKNLTEIRAELDAIAIEEKVADDAFDAARKKIGIKNCPRWGLVRVQTDRGPHDWGQGEIESAAARGQCYGANVIPDECERALAELELLEREGKTEEDRLGLTPLRTAVEAANGRWGAVMEVAASTPAQTVADLVIKLELTFKWDGCAVDERLKKGAVEDAKRIGGAS